MIIKLIFVNIFLNFFLKLLIIIQKFFRIFKTLIWTFLKLKNTTFKMYKSFVIIHYSLITLKFFITLKIFAIFARKFQIF
jgi:hypothetical protein